MLASIAHVLNLIDATSHSWETVSCEVEGLMAFCLSEFFSFSAKLNKKLENNSPVMSLKFPSKLHVLFVPVGLHVTL